MKVYFTRDFECFLTMEIHVSAVKCCISKSTGNSISLLSLTFSAFLNLGSPNCTYF